jgi:hypothetical protein
MTERVRVSKRLALDWKKRYEDGESIFKIAASTKNSGFYVGGTALRRILRSVGVAIRRPGPIKS